MKHYKIPHITSMELLETFVEVCLMLTVPLLVVLVLWVIH